MPMRSYDTLVEALNALQAEGFTRDFNLLSSHIACPATGATFEPNEFQVIEFHRFEGQTDPADSMIVYAIEASDGSRGTFVHAYGAQATALSAEMSSHLHFADR